MGSKNKTTSNVNQTTTNAPPAWADPVMQQISQHIGNSLPGLANINYTGDFVAAPSQMSQQAADAYYGAALTAQGLVPTAQGALNQAFVLPTFEGPSLAAGTGSFAGTGGMEAAIQAAVNPVYRNLTEQLLPSLMSSGMESGAYGGSRAQAALPSMVLRDANREMMDIASLMSYQDFTDTAARNLEAYGLGTQRGLGEANVLTDRLGLTPELLDAVMRMSGGAAELMQQGGALDTANRQAVINNDLARFEYEMNKPFMGYDVATDLITRLASGYGTSNTTGTTTTTQKTGGLAPIVGGALGLAGMIGGFPVAGGGSLGGSLVSSLFGGR